MNAPIPVSIITGFLGAGKTSLLNTLVKDPMLSAAAVIINEFGDVGIDHLLVEKSGESVIEMTSGCLCCTIRGDLAETIHGLLARRDNGSLKPFDRIVIETTGLADPAPVLHTIMREPALLRRCRLEGVITVVDGVNGEATLDAHAEAVKQVAVADRVVLTKLDLLCGLEGEKALFSIIARIRKLAPGARMLTTHRGEAEARHLFNTGPYNAETKSVDVKAWLNAESHGHRHRHHHTDSSRHDAHIRSFSFSEDRAISPQGLEMFIELLQSLHGADLLRMKAIVKVGDNPESPVVLHGVQHVFHPPTRLAAWPDDDHRTRLVFIVKDIGQSVIEDLFRAFTDQVDGAGAKHLDKTLSLT